MADFTLSAHDKVQGLWLRLKAHLDERLLDARRRNDNPLSEIDTATLRGEIRALKHILGLADERTILTGDDQPG